MGIANGYSIVFGLMRTVDVMIKAAWGVGASNADDRNVVHDLSYISVVIVFLLAAWS